ncbi:MAG TPA: RNA polymerase sigma-70 factor [Chitinophaga sp.]|uniref:RNA polymerase sigma-70 factor n=1 Tax=Chitinophaga sp. TaxID=1869181 RepID=UPI002BB8D8C8|nr:RNA polymerase sigma-70 factor [Chitinophaga sp.]HVI47150.1 RNA polymerase sigma-70 factor [Chitinophaga sp.]
MEGHKDKDQLTLFGQLFHVYHVKLHRYAFTMLKDNDAASDVVQSVFIKLWEKRDVLLMEEAIGSYLYKSTHNLCLNHIRNTKTREHHTQYAAADMTPVVNNTKDKVLTAELSGRIQGVLESLPTQCRIIFIKSRMEGKKYAEIAAELEISVKTVEAQIGKALKIFREKLGDYLVIMAIITGIIL